MRSLGTFLVTFLNLGLLRCSAFLTGRIAAAGSILSPTDQDRRRGGDRGAVSFLPAQSDPSSLTQTESGKAMKEGTGVETWVPGDPLLLKFFASDYCPYCHRVWLLLVHQKVSFERHLIDLASESKPPFFLEINPEGKVPTVLAHPVDDQTPEVHVESLDILRWISRETGFDKDLTEEEKQRVEDILSDWQLIEDVTWNLMCENNGRACEKLQRKNCSETLYDFDRKVARFQKEGKGGRFLAGTLQPSLADFAFWPLFERMIPVLSSVKKYEIFGQKGYRYPRPVLKAWAVAMGELEAVKAVRLPDSNYVQLHQYYVRVDLFGYGRGMWNKVKTAFFKNLYGGLLWGMGLQRLRSDVEQMERLVSEGKTAKVMSGRAERKSEDGVVNKGSLSQRMERLREKGSALHTWEIWRDGKKRGEETIFV